MDATTDAPLAEGCAVAVGVGGEASQLVALGVVVPQAASSVPATASSARKRGLVRIAPPIVAGRLAGTDREPLEAGQEMWIYASQEAAVRGWEGAFTGSFRCSIGHYGRGERT
jgi:hypothetical protein